MKRTIAHPCRKAVIYARVSSKEQEKDGFSIPAQLKLLNAYAVKEKLVVVMEFVDVETAKQAGRTQFNALLTYLEEHPEVRIILVEKTDRLYRNFRDYVTIDERDVEVHLVKEAEVLSHDSRSHQKFIHGIKVLMAKNYIDNLSEETKKGMNEKAEQGGYPHRAPVGYVNDTVNHTIVVDPERADFVRRMFEWYATGNYSLQDIRQRCIEAGFRGGWGSRPISKSKVEWILKNPFYTGQFRWHGKLLMGKHEPIISRDLFDRVQAMFVARERKKGKPRKNDFAFSGLMVCGECGCAVTAEIQKGRYVYYHCTNYHGNCNEGFYREETLEDQFAEIVRRIQLDEETAEWIKLALRDSLADETRFYQQAVGRLTAQLEQVKRRLNQAYLDKLDGKITEEFWAEKSSEWQTEQARLIAELTRHQESDSGYLDSGVHILELAEQAYDLYLHQPPAEKRRLLTLLLSNCTLTNGKISPVYRQPFDIIVVMAEQATNNKPADREGQPVLQEWGG
ncbi:MAG: recombinase family protein [Planctomycetes bacterium]|nr:recombinase family protein [Planctomycetota bacterium]